MDSVDCIIRTYSKCGCSRIIVSARPNPWKLYMLTAYNTQDRHHVCMHMHVCTLHMLFKYRIETEWEKLEIISFSLVLALVCCDEH